MAIETRVAQKDKLYGLLLVQKAYEHQGAGTAQELDRLISNARAVMEAEDVAYVEKEVAKVKI